MKVKITNLSFVDRDDIPGDLSITKFYKPPLRFSDIKRFTYIDCKVDENDIWHYETKRGKKTPPNQWNIYRIIKDESENKSKYYFRFNCDNKKDFVRIFEERLNQRLFPPDDNFEAKLSIVM